MTFGIKRILVEIIAPLRVGQEDRFVNWTSSGLLQFQEAWGIATSILKDLHQERTEGLV